jgi:hypothetical protein
MESDAKIADVKRQLSEYQKLWHDFNKKVCNDITLMLTEYINDLGVKPTSMCIRYTPIFEVGTTEPRFGSFEVNVIL